MSCRFLVFRGNHRRDEFETDLVKNREEFVAIIERVTKKRYACETDAQRALEAQTPHDLGITLFISPFFSRSLHYTSQDLYMYNP